MAADFASEGLAMLSPPITTIQADVTSDDDVQRVVSIVLERHGRIEVLVAGTAMWADDLAEFFVAEGCSDALNLDGGTSSQLHLRRAGILVEEPGGVPVPVAVGLFVAKEHAEAVPPRGCRSRMGCSATAPR